MTRFFAIFILFAILFTSCSTAGPQAGVTPTQGQSPAATNTQPPYPPAATNPPVATNPPEATPTTAAEPVPTDTTEPAAPTPTTFTPRSAQDLWIAYIGADANVWLVNPATSAKQQVTTDAAPLLPGTPEPDPEITYQSIRWSSDGQFISFRRDEGRKVETGYNFTFSLWVYDLTAGQARAVLENQSVIGHDWKPGTREIVYAQDIPQEYFTQNRGELASEFAKGLWYVNVDTGESAELVAPERGFTLVNPRWSPDGRFLSFEEVYLMEGRGKFAYYDMQAKQYVAWDEPIGNYDWSKDGNYLAYDRLTYIATNEERIFLKPVQGGEEKEISAPLEEGYAYGPVFSPVVDQLAYLTTSGDPGTAPSYIWVIHYQGGVPFQAGGFQNPTALSWTPDGTHLVFSVGPFESQKVVIQDVNNNSVTELADGRFPVAAPVYTAGTE